MTLRHAADGEWSHEEPITDYSKFDSLARNGEHLCAADLSASTGVSH